MIRPSRGTRTKDVTSRTAFPACLATWHAKRLVVLCEMLRHGDLVNPRSQRFRRRGLDIEVRYRIGRWAVHRLELALPGSADLVAKDLIERWRAMLRQSSEDVIPQFK